MQSWGGATFVGPPQLTSQLGAKIHEKSVQEPSKTIPNWIMFLVRFGSDLWWILAPFCGQKSIRNLCRILGGPLGRSFGWCLGAPWGLSGFPWVDVHSSPAQPTPPEAEQKQMPTSGWEVRMAGRLILDPQGPPKGHPKPFRGAASTATCT